MSSLGRGIVATGGRRAEARLGLERRGALSALPGGAIVLADVTVGIVVAMLGVPPLRRARPPAEIVLAVLVVAAVSAMVAVRRSRWYVAPAGSALIVLLLGGATSRNALDTSFSERLVETAIGAAPALGFGVAIPRLVEAVGDRDRLEP